MTKRKVTKLFAVVALAASAPAAADGPAPRVVRADPWTVRAAVDRRPRPPIEQPSALTKVVLQSLGMSVPRTLRTGAPACGNVASRSLTSSCEEVLEEEGAVGQPVVEGQVKG